MKMNLFVVLIPVLLLAACGEKDTVPKVEDPHNIVVDGAAMKQNEFLKKYCEGKTQHETCVKVQRAMVQDSTKGAVPRF
jgi:hypothetical protein